MEGSLRSDSEKICIDCATTLSKTLTVIIILWQRPYSRGYATHLGYLGLAFQFGVGIWDLQWDGEYQQTAGARCHEIQNEGDLIELDSLE